jgi:hypothetical protein
MYYRRIVSFIFFFVSIIVSLLIYFRIILERFPKTIIYKDNIILLVIGIIIIIINCYTLWRLKTATNILKYLKHRRMVE